MSEMRVLVTDPLGDCGLEVLRLGGADVTIGTDLDSGQLAEAIGEYDALIVRSGTVVTEEHIARADRMKVIARAGVGIDNVDVKAATRRGIAVTNTPDSNTNAAVEQTMALMLAAARNTAHAHASMRDGEWERSKFVGVELRGRTLGVIGFGRIGRGVSVLARSFGMDVLAYDPYVPEIVARDHEVRLTELDEVLRSSDVLTLHLAARDDVPLIDAAALAEMKKGAILVNASRGSLVDAAAVADSLDRGHLGAVAVDVYEKEPPGADHPLLGHPNAVHTPHLGASTGEAVADVSRAVASQVLQILRGEGYPNAVNVALKSTEQSEALLFIGDRIGRIQAAMADAPIQSVEIEVQMGDGSDGLAATAATGVLSGILAGDPDVNYVSAPVIAEQRGIKISTAQDLSDVDQPHHLAVRVRTQDTERTVAGALIGGSDPRIVRISRFQLDARPEGIVLMLLNHDVPGVVGSIGQVLGDHGVNIAEWRLGREQEGGTAISFVNLDSPPSDGCLAELMSLSQVMKATIVEL